MGATDDADRVSNPPAPSSGRRVGAPYPAPRRWLIGAVAVGIFALGLWAGRATLASVASVPTAESSAVAVEVTDQTLSQMLSLNVTVSRQQGPVAANLLAGVVTRVRSGNTLAEGDCPYWVSAVPVCAIKGSTPMYRALSVGATGSDVAEVRSALHRLGYLGSAAGDSYDVACRDAVRAWQRHLGASPTGELALGTLLVMDRLPATIALAPELRPGSQLAGGESLIMQSTGTPEFSLVVTPDQAGLVPSDARLKVHFESQVWPARISGSRTLENGSTSFALVAPDGGVVCGNDCGRLPPGTQTYLSSDIEVVPPTTGPVVPVAAIITTASGSTVVYVVDPASGETSATPVRVRASLNGMAVVSGVSVGQRVIAAPDATHIPGPAVSTTTSVSTPGSPSGTASASGG